MYYDVSCPRCAPRPTGVDQDNQRVPWKYAFASILAGRRKRDIHVPSISIAMFCDCVELRVFIVVASMFVPSCLCENMHDSPDMDTLVSINMPRSYDAIQIQFVTFIPTFGMWLTVARTSCSR